MQTLAGKWAWILNRDCDRAQNGSEKFGVWLFRPSLELAKIFNSCFISLA
jgi:hypothetical protein